MALKQLTKIISVVVNLAEYKAIEKSATRAALSISGYFRDKLGLPQRAKVGRPKAKVKKKVPA